MPHRSYRSCSRNQISVHSHNAKSGKKFTYCKTSRPSKPSKGWKRSAPKRGVERHLIYKRCGSRCFLKPSTQGFPICSAYRNKTGRTLCKPDCRGLLSAERRAKQYKYEGIARKARRIAKSSGCSWVH